MSHFSWSSLTGTPQEELAFSAEQATQRTRGTCVYLLLDLGVPPHIVRDNVGHSDIEVTMTIYAHAALDEKRKALSKLGNALS